MDTASDECCDDADHVSARPRANWDDDDGVLLCSVIDNTVVSATTAVSVVGNSIIGTGPVSSLVVHGDGGLDDQVGCWGATCDGRL